MEEIYVNAENDNDVGLMASQNQRGPRGSQRRCYGAVVFCLGLLTVGLLVGLIRLGLHYHDSVQRSTAELFTLKTNLTDHLLASNNKVSSLNEELERLQDLWKQIKTCHAGWIVFDWSCYLLSNVSGTRDEGREDCRDRGAHLVVVDSYKEQMFLSGFTKKSTWIGLSDREEEGTWRWVDGSPLNLTYWGPYQPNNGGGVPPLREEDCVIIRTTRTTFWNDRSCNGTLQWICEKTA